MPEHDYLALTKQQLADARGQIQRYDDAQWETPSLCEGWKVKDVFAHAVTGYSIPVPKAVWLIAKNFGNTNKVADQVARDYAASHTREEEVADFIKFTSYDKPVGFVKTIKPAERYPDHLLHEFDVTVPLGMTRELPAGRWIPALDSIPNVGGGAGYKKRAKGLRLVATDVDWSHGDGPEVRGPALALLQATAGRAIGLETLEGDGLATLTERVKA
jgi:uncharacterized protein (TIGR03083 family)